MEANGFCCQLQAILQGFCLGRCICKKYSIICIVCVCYSFFEISPGFCLSLALNNFLLLGLSMFNVRSLVDNKQIWCECISLQNSCNTVVKVSVAIWWVNNYLCLFIKYHLQTILNKSWGQHPTKQQLYGHRPPITKTIQVRRTRHVGHCRRSKDEPISDILLWTPSHGWTKARRPTRNYRQQLCADTVYSLEDLPGAMDDREGWRERFSEIRAGSVTWWWWYAPSSLYACNHMPCRNLKTIVLPLYFLLELLRRIVRI